jgi:hypothetical protein
MSAVIRFAVLLAIVSLFVGCGGYDVRLEVTGSAESVSVTYHNQSGGTSQVSSAGLPWSYRYEGFDGDFFYVSAQNKGSSGTVTVSVYVDGRKYKTSTSSGGFVIATASGSL